MITEKSFALGFSGFWQQLLPLLDRYVRTMNLQQERFAVPLYSASSKLERGVVNEAGFRIFAAARAQGESIKNLASNAIQDSINCALRYIRTMRKFESEKLEPPDEAGVGEAIEIALRLDAFFGKREDSALLIDPPFEGCGWIQACSGDALKSEILFEVKAGGREFRGADIRQALTYCALNYAVKRYDITTLCFVNPRRGVYVTENIERLCQETGGASGVEVLSTIVEYVSDRQGPDSTD